MMRFIMMWIGLIFSGLIGVAQSSKQIKNKSAAASTGIKIGSVKLEGKYILLCFLGDTLQKEMPYYISTINKIHTKVPGLQLIRAAQGSRELEKTYQVAAFPTSFLLDDKGKVLHRFLGSNVDSVVNMYAAVLKYLPSKNQQDIDYINQADALFEKFNAAAELNAKIELLKQLDLKNPYSANLKGKMEGKLVIAFAEKNDLTKAKEYLSKIENSVQKLEVTLELAQNLYSKKQHQESIALVQNAMDGVLTSSPAGEVSLEHVNVYGGLALLHTLLIPNEGNEALYVKYLKPIFETCGFFPADPHITKGGQSPVMEHLLTYQYALALSGTATSAEVAKVWAAYLHAESDPEGRTAEVLQQFAHVKGLSEHLKSIIPSGNEANREKLFKICLQPDIDGKVWGLPKIKAKYILVDFWASWCTPCRASHPHLKEVYAKYKDKGLEMIGIAAEHSPNENVRRFNCRRAVEKDGTTWIQLLQATDGLEQLAPFTTEHMLVKKVIFDRNGKIHGIFGGKDAQGLDKKLEEIF